MIPPRQDLKTALKEQCPTLKEAIDTLAERWTAGIRRALTERQIPPHPKVFNDPVWGTIELMSWEVLLLDSLILQRLRGVRQLGFAHYVYPGAGHDRLEHVRGVVEATERMISRLERNAGHRRRYDALPDTAIPEVSQQDRMVCRLAALLHDIGHGPFSHASEPLLESRHGQELHTARRLLQDHFEGIGTPSASELVAIFLILSPALDEVFNHPAFPFPDKHETLGLAVAARILGARNYLKASYLSGIVSGPTDADKLDYMARDSHHAGLPVGLDLNRLISKLEVITVTPTNAPPGALEVQKRAEQARDQRLHEMGISLSGIGAYEQMLVGRVLLYDRLYYHHKTRAAEAMAQRLAILAEEERGAPFDVQDLYTTVSDDLMIALLGGIVTLEGFQGGGPRSLALARDLLERRLYHRAFAFAVRFIAGLDQWAEEDKDRERAALWHQIPRAVAGLDQTLDLSAKIYDKARDIGHALPALTELAETLRPEHILVDFPSNKIKPSGNLLLTRTAADEVGLPNLFFDPEKWSNAYDQQKRCGYIFCPQPYIPLVALASKLFFFERFNVVMTPAADRLTKTTAMEAQQKAWLDALLEQEVINAESHKRIKEGRTPLARLTPETLELPDAWIKNDPDLKSRLVENIHKGHPGGFPSTTRNVLSKALSLLSGFLAAQTTSGTLTHQKSLSERDLQQAVRTFFLAKGADPTEGEKIAGGNADLILDRTLVIENKVVGRCQDPFAKAPDAPFQARRYASALCQSLVVTLVAYQPTDEAALRTGPDAVRVIRHPIQERAFLEIRFVLPYGLSAPSYAKAPAAPP